MSAIIRPLLSQTLTAILFGAVLLIPVAAFVLGGDRDTATPARLAAASACDIVSSDCTGTPRRRATRFPVR